MARTGAAVVVLAFAVCCLLVAPAPARQRVDAPRQLPDAVDREAAAEKLLPQPVQQAADQATAIAVLEKGTAIAVQEEGPVAVEERPQKRSSLLCLVFRCGGGGDAEPKGAGWVAVARGRWQALEEWAQQAYDSDSDCDSDSDDEDEEGGIVGWFRRLADGF